MSNQVLLSLQIVRHCPESRPYPLFDEHGKEILPCGRAHCETRDGQPFYPRTIRCANESCFCGKQNIRSLCPAVIYCSHESFQATQTQTAWDDANWKTPQKLAEEEYLRRKEQQKVNRRKRLSTLRGKLLKRGQNQRNYARGRAREFVRKLRQDFQYRTSFLREAVGTSELPTGGLWRNRRSARKKNIRNP